MTKNCLPKSLYLHVPFCKSICYYCDFAHQLYREEIVERWLTALTFEISKKCISNHLETIYIGGGTPTSLNEEQLTRLLKILEPYSSFAEEYTIEINPETVNEEKIKIISQFGINRVSIGYQACQEDILKMLNRHHTVSDVETCILLCRKYGIDNISLDLMYSLPNTDLQMVQESVRYALSLNPTHLSLYSLIIEENSVFGRNGIKPCEEDVEADMYDWIYNELTSNGFHQYEISNFAIDEDHESKHNKVYWNYEDFYGVSLGASGKEGNVRYDNTRSMKEYLDNPLKCEHVYLEKKDAMFEMLMMGLRLRKGMSLKGFEKRFNVSFDDVFKNPKEKCIKNGWLLESDEYIYCTDTGYHLLNTVLIEFLPE